MPNLKILVLCTGIILLSLSFTSLIKAESIQSYTQRNAYLVINNELVYSGTIYNLLDSAFNKELQGSLIYDSRFGALSIGEFAGNFSISNIKTESGINSLPANDDFRIIMGKNDSSFIPQDIRSLIENNDAVLVYEETEAEIKLYIITRDEFLLSILQEQLNYYTNYYNDLNNNIIYFNLPEGFSYFEPISCDSANETDFGDKNETYGCLNNGFDWMCDTCTDNKNLIEFYCSDWMVATKFYKCAYGCSNGACITRTPRITCSKNSDCGTDGLDGGSWATWRRYCSNNNVVQNYRIYTCQNPGTTSSRCRSSIRTNPEIIETCEFGCQAGACQNCPVGYLEEFNCNGRTLQQKYQNIQDEECIQNFKNIKTLSSLKTCQNILGDGLKLSQYAKSTINCQIGYFNEFRCVSKLDGDVQYDNDRNAIPGNILQQKKSYIGVEAIAGTNEFSYSCKEGWIDLKKFSSYDKCQATNTAKLAKKPIITGAAVYSETAGNNVINRIIDFFRNLFG